MSTRRSVEERAAIAAAKAAWLKIEVAAKTRPEVAGLYAAYGKVMEAAEALGELEDAPPTALLAIEGVAHMIAKTLRELGFEVPA